MKKIFLTIVSFALIYSMPIHAQWVQTNGPYGGAVAAFVNCGGDLFAALDQGIYRSTDGALTWSVVRNQYLYEGVNSLASNGDTLFASVQQLGIFRSTNKGATWKTLVSGISGRNIVTVYVLGAQIYAGTAAGVFRSDDDGEHFGFTGLSEASIVTGYRNQNYLFAASSDKLFRSNDNGRSWDTVYYADEVDWSSKLTGNTSYLFACSYQGFSRSADNGEHWSKINTGLPGTSINDLAVSDSTIYAGTNDGIYCSKDNGSNWGAVNFGLTTMDAKSLLINGSIIYAGTDCGVFRSTIDSISWTYSSTGLERSKTQCIGIEGHNIYASTYYGIYISTDEGLNWRHCLSGIPAPAVEITVHHGIAYIVTYNDVYRSTDTGSSWKSTSNGITDTRISSLVSSDSMVFAGTPAGAFRSTNRGETWFTMNSGFDFPDVNSLVCTESKLYAANAGEIYRMNLPDTTWSLLSRNIPPPQIIRLGISGPNILVATRYSGIYRSSDNATTWYQTDSILSSPTVYSFTAADTIVCVTSNKGASLSTDDGFSWRSLDSPSPDTGIKSLSIDGNEVYAVTMDGDIWKRPLSEMITSVKKVSNDLPKTYSLDQNYPNPFNPSTNFGFRIAKLDFVTLKIYNMLGLNVATLINEKLEPGSYTKQWNAGSMPSGVYIYRLTAGTYTDTKKLMVIK